MAAVLTLANISKDVYADAGSGAIGGYKRVEGLTRSIWGGSSFYGGLYIQGQNGVLAFRGSLELQDWTDADGSIACGMFPINQIGDAFDLFSRAKTHLARIGAKRILITGHSLGGGLTQIIASRVTSFPVIGVTFNAPGMASLSGAVRFESGNAKNIFNYRADRDPVSLSGRHIGGPPVSVRGGGMHPIGALIAALETSPAGCIKH